MKIVLADLVVEVLKDAPPVQRAFDKQLRFLAANLYHPSLHAKSTMNPTTIWRGLG